MRQKKCLRAEGGGGCGEGIVATVGVIAISLQHIVKLQHVGKLAMCFP